MEITISKSELYQRLKELGKIIPQKSNIVDYYNFMFEISGNNLKITAGDDSGRIITTMECQSDIQNLSVLLDAKMMLNGLVNIPEQPLVISFDPQESYINTTVRYNNGKFDVVGGTSKNYPVLNMSEPLSTIMAEADKLLYALHKVQVCCATDEELRVVMNGVFIKFEKDNVTCVGTNGLTLAKDEFKGTDQNDYQVILPRKFSNLLISIFNSTIDNDIKISDTTNNVGFELGAYRIIARKIDGHYPNYNSVIPQNNYIDVVCNRKDLISAIKRVSAFESESSYLIVFDFSQDKLVISAEDSSFGRSANETLSIEQQNSREPIKIGFNSNYLMLILSTIVEEEIIISMKDPSLATTVTGRENTELLYLIMPLSINQ